MGLLVEAFANDLAGQVHRDVPNLAPRLGQGACLLTGGLLARLGLRLALGLLLRLATAPLLLTLALACSTIVEPHSQIIVPLGICFVVQQTSRLDPIDIWLAILAGHATRCALSVIRFNQGQWRTIAVGIDGSTP